MTCCNTPQYKHHCHNVNYFIEYLTKFLLHNNRQSLDSLVVGKYNWDIFMGRQGHHGIMIQTITHSLRCCNAFYDLQMLQHRSTKINHDILQGTSNIFTWLKYFQKQNLKLFRLKLNICKTCNVPCCQCCRWLNEASPGQILIRRDHMTQVTGH